MDEQAKEVLKNRGMIEIQPGIWTTSARTPAEDSADWSKYALTDEERERYRERRDGGNE